MQVRDTRTLCVCLTGASPTGRSCTMRQALRVRCACGAPTEAGRACGAPGDVGCARASLDSPTASVKHG